MSHRQILVMLALLGLLLWGGAWFTQHVELRRVERQTPLSGEALHNPLLAAQRFLRAMHIEADSITLSGLLDAMPDSGEVVVIDSNRPTIRPDADQRLLAWCAVGGA